MTGEELDYEIVGKILYAGFDAEGNIHLILKNNHKFWSNVAVNLLKTMEGNVVKMSVKPWNSKNALKRAGNGRRRSHFYVLRENNRLR